MSYQGYTNWETWAVSLYCDNTYDVYTHFTRQAEQLRDAGKGDRSIMIILARRIREFIKDVPKREITSESLKLSAVDWQEVAASFVGGVT